MPLTSFSAAFQNPAGSPIRELFPYLSQPGIISFAGGYPSSSLFDSLGLRHACESAIATPFNCLQYGATEGLPVLREALVELMAARGIATGINDILVTTGSQQAFDLIVKVFLNQGDMVYVETPAYPAAIQGLRLAGARMTQIPVDCDGVDVVRLAEILSQANETDLPKFIYTVPTFSNPSGTTLSSQRRSTLVGLALQYGFMIVEDDPYGELSFTEERLLPLFSIGASTSKSENPVVYLSSLSKTVAPGLRVGWMVAPPDVLRRCTIAKQTSDLCTSPISQQIAVEYLLSGRYFPCILRAKIEYKLRMSTMASALHKQLGDDLKFSEPKGGMFMWASITNGCDAKALFKHAVTANVLFVPGAAFYPENPDEMTLRFSFAAPDSEQIKEGVNRLSTAFKKLFI
jgi:2-aminoadipate transaminase